MEHIKKLEHVILKLMKGLPQESVEEIADFALFVRRKTLQPDLFQQDLASELLQEELSEVDRTETDHLEGEFADYQRIFPKQ